MDAATGVAAEVLLEVGDELRGASLAVVGRQPDEAGEIVLARDLALSEPVGDHVEQALLPSDLRHVADRPAAERLQELLGGIACEERRAL